MASKPSLGSMSDSVESRETAIKLRIINHMNADHQASLQLYLRHFCKVPESQSTSAKLTEITTKYMIITSDAGRNVIPFEPPMQSLSEARERVVGLHHQAMAGLGLSEVKIHTWAPPNKVWQALIFVLAAWTFASFPFRSQLLPESGSFVSRIWSIGGSVPGLARLAHKTAPVVLLGMVVIHSAEAENFSRTRLRKHQVPVGSRVWWMWMVNTFIGGVSSFDRFDELVKQKETASKKEGKH